MGTRVGMLCVGIIVLVSESSMGQQPTGTRTSLMINEIMPNPGGGQCPWIEIANPTEDEVSLEGFAVLLDYDLHFELPHSAGQLSSGPEVL